jgi:hypothetical protein
MRKSSPLIECAKTGDAVLYPFSLPTKADKVPAGTGWIHEIKHDGYRMMLIRDQDRVRLISRDRVYWARPLITTARTLMLRYCTAVISITSLATASSTASTLRAFETAIEITQNVAGSSAADTAGANSTSCEDKLTAFVAELDALLGDRTTSLNQMNDLIKKYFPLNHCNIDKAIDIARGSKYALPVGRWRDQTTFGFSSKSENNDGYLVTFILRNSSGDSELPSVTHAVKSL